MNSKRHTLDSVAAKWHALPSAEAVGHAAKRLCEEYRPASSSTREFRRLLVTVVRELSRAGDKGIPRGPDALGLALAWLSAAGGSDELHLAFSVGDPEATRQTIIALRDSFLGQLQADYRRYLIVTRCPDWATRHELAKEWREHQAPAAVANHRAWEFTDCVEEILDSVGAGQRLLDQLGGLPPPLLPPSSGNGNETSNKTKL